MPHAVTGPSPGVQALILCGPGSSFTTFNSSPDENPKALLPIANRPMVWYPVDYCYRMGINDITLICPASAKDAMQAALSTNPVLTSLPHPRPEILAPAGLTQTMGTAEILRLPEVRSLVQSDFMVLPCDLVCELAGEKLLAAWMVQSASLSDIVGYEKLSGDSSIVHSGGLSVFYETRGETPRIKGEETDYIGVTEIPATAAATQKGSLLPDISNLVVSLPTDSYKDLTEEHKGFPIRHSLLKEHPNVRFMSSKRDAHIYILPRWIMDLVQKNETFESIGEDVIGWWAKATWQDGLGTKLGLGEILNPKSNEHTYISHGGSDTASVGQPETSGNHSKSNKGSSGNGSEGPTPLQGSVPFIQAYIHPTDPTGPIIRRVDTAKLLLHVSLQIAKLPSLEEAGAEPVSPFAHARKVAYPEGVQARTTITKHDSLIADSVTVEEKTSIKECVIGANCQISEGAKLVQCLLMDGVKVGKSCKLTRCILGKRSVIGDGSVLTDCEVQENLLVEPRTEQKDDRLMSSEGLEASDGEDDAMEGDREAEDSDA
ncbi:Translation initiation factor eIF-2B subunit gamma [Ceratocystis pirilliformis]|uniref:Translation initiation factor eIF2B subunit gamma n=1 Tax=Ceratocystis pirilliformis TaxID=259994 RepID=A0ABR3YP49_9PEZI